MGERSPNNRGQQEDIKQDITHGLGILEGKGRIGEKNYLKGYVQN